MARPYTTKDLKIIRELAVNTHPAEIARILDRTEGSVRVTASRIGIKFGVSNRIQHGREAMQKVIRMRKKGYTLRQISIVTGVPMTTCYNMSRRFV